jgi:two-component SAPR family response regulator
MPLMNGKDVAEKITKIHPETSVLFMSGNIENVIPDDINLEEPINFIGKPFSSSKLTLRVREILKT